MKNELKNTEDQELKEGRERQRRYREEDLKKAEESNKKDLSILDYFDTKPSLEPLDNIYQIPVIYPTPQPSGFIGQIAIAIYLRLCENNTVNINLKCTYVNVEVDLEYINGFLNHHYNYYNGVKSDFLNHLFTCIAFSRKVFGESKEYTSNKSYVDSWVNNKLISDTNSKRIKRSYTEIIKPLFKEGFNPDVYLKMLKDAKPKIINDKGEYIKGVNGRKAPVIAWIDFLEKKGIINIHNDENKAKLLMDLIPNFAVNARSVRGEKTSRSKKYIHYSNEFITLFNII